MMGCHGCDARGAPLPWIVQWAGLVAPDAVVLDLAAGRGRHALFFAERGNKVVARRSRHQPPARACQHRAADRRSGRRQPVAAAGRRFGAVVVTNYLHRPLMPALLDAIEPGGVLLYQTFMEGNERFGKPNRPDHLLKDGELLELVRGTILGDGLRGAPDQRLRWRWCSGSRRGAC